MDYDAVKAIVNAIGGVEIEVTEPMHYDNYLELQIDFEPGVYKMNGDRAIEYLRFRENIKADIGRTERQQYFLTELIKQTLTAKNIFALPKLADAYLKYVDTNIGANIILDAMQLAGSLDTGKIRTETLTGHGERLPASDGIIIDYFILDETHMRNTIEDMFGPYLKK
ncbi:MAG: LCP family protein [Tissierellia bacterium]|nr:LCP family protein [Tissierellia bacterium]